MPSQEELKKAWESLDTLIYRVLDAEGNQVANAQVRQYGEAWLFYDEEDGYLVIDSEQVQNLVLA
ncbi:MAG: hypothetical protein AMXMBFR33_48160 [Candidatus Xenobia bacterium]|jgi:hypothetical protein